MRARTIAAAGAVLLAVLAGCSSDSKDSGSGSSSTTKAPAEVLDILVSNDDGYAAQGLDVLVQALRAMPDVKVTVVAPAENKSGTGSQTTPGALTTSERTTRRGYPATAVNGFPSDSVTYGLTRVLSEKPDLVVTGINEGQNLGPIASISGTVGAAKTAAAAGVPALAASQGLTAAPDYPSAAKLVVDWITARRAALLDGSAAVNVVNLNVPTCTSGTVRGLRQEPLATTGNGLAPPADCTSTATELTGDVEAFLAGFATATELTPTGETVTTSTTWPASG